MLTGTGNFLFVTVDFWFPREPDRSDDVLLMLFDRFQAIGVAQEILKATKVDR